MTMNQVVPFSNATEAMLWLDNNCDSCKRPSCYTKTKMQFGFISGTIGIKQAEFIGCLRHGDYVDLKDKCTHFTKTVLNKKKHLKNEKTLNLFK